VGGSLTEKKKIDRRKKRPVLHLRARDVVVGKERGRRRKGRTRAAGASSSRQKGVRKERRKDPFLYSWRKDVLLSE